MKWRLLPPPTSGGGGGGSGAPVDAQYVVMALNGTLTNERRLVAGQGMTINDGGANGDVEIICTVPAVAYAGYFQPGPIVKLSDLSYNPAQDIDLNIGPADGMGILSLDGDPGDYTDLNIFVNSSNFSGQLIIQEFLIVIQGDGVHDWSGWSGTVNVGFNIAQFNGSTPTYSTLPNLNWRHVLRFAAETDGSNVMQYWFDIPGIYTLP